MSSYAVSQSITGTWSGSVGYENSFVSIKSVREQQGDGIHPALYFKYIKKKFSLLQRPKMDKRMKVLERAFDAAANNGQDMLANKILREIACYARESVMFAKGIKWCIEEEFLRKYKNQIRGGHISDTDFQHFTRVVPANVLKRKKELEGVFDGFVIYHYWDQKTADKGQKMTQEERSKMRDPVLFGKIDESDKLYFIIDWEDEYCDLSLDEMLTAIGKEYDELKLPAKPNF